MSGLLASDKFADIIEEQGEEEGGGGSSGGSGGGLWFEDWIEDDGGAGGRGRFIFRYRIKKAKLANVNLAIWNEKQC